MDGRCGDISGAPFAIADWSVTRAHVDAVSDLVIPTDRLVVFILQCARFREGPTARDLADSLSALQKRPWVLRGRLEAAHTKQINHLILQITLKLAGQATYLSTEL